MPPRPGPMYGQPPQPYGYHQQPYGYQQPYGQPMPPPYGRPLPPPYGYAPHGYRRPPPRKSGWFGSLLTVLTVCGIVGALVVAAVAMSEQTSANQAATTTPPSHTYSSNSPVPTTSSAPTSTTTVRTSARTTAPTTTKPAGPQPVIALGQHPLFRDDAAGLGNLDCDLPRWSTDAAVAKAFFAAAQVCLDQMWKANLAAANLPFRSPGLVVAVNPSELSSPCGGASSDAFYCSASSTIYMSTAGLVLHNTPYPPMEALSVYAHEYGHHVQGLTGLLQASSNQRREQGTMSAGGLETSRRMELQASCFGGMYIGSSEAGGSWTSQEGYAAVKHNYNRGDGDGRHRDHGTPEHNGNWYNHGYTKNRNFECNTWLAPADEVS
ncbi:neutral zinc metallopeptidase [Nocardia neocaledoniensis]|uniref:neutral zinc metallopeptidase n=1 Tax=Nocardia neocaledoniensis TaxID=236511 RepID=UPI002456474F|nr:neutral zinc metallopeptidase [Nocardia neocaledoniensis]